MGRKDPFKVRPRDGEEWSRTGMSGVRFKRFIRPKQPEGVPLFCDACLRRFYAEKPRRWCSLECMHRGLDAVRETIRRTGEALDRLDRKS